MCLGQGRLTRCQPRTDASNAKVQPCCEIRRTFEACDSNIEPPRSPRAVEERQYSGLAPSYIQSLLSLRRHGQWNLRRHNPGSLAVRPLELGPMHNSKRVRIPALMTSRFKLRHDTSVAPRAVRTLKPDCELASLPYIARVKSEARSLGLARSRCA